MFWIPTLIQFIRPKKKPAISPATTNLDADTRRQLVTLSKGTYNFERGPLSPDEECAKLKAAYEFEVRQGIINRMHGLRQTLCRVNCKPSLHRPACKDMKKDIETLKEIIL